MKLFFSLALLLSVNFAYGFVENTTHGYAACTTCHYSPAGGNLLNDYGRSLSAELMSTWSTPDVENSFWGLYKENKWFRLGGDFRTLQRYLDNSTIEDREFFVMQDNVELGFKHKKFMVVGTLGSIEGPDGTPDRRDFISERHYLMYDATPTSRVRLGKFRRNYGINDPNHNRVTKRLLGFGSNSESYNLEYTKFSENWDLVVNYSLGRIDQTRRSNDERSLHAKWAHYINGKSRLGTNLLIGESPSQDRTLLGVFGINPITEKSYVLYELNYETKENNLNSQKQDNLLLHTRVGYELFKGFKGYGIFEYTEDLDNSDSVTTAPGLGFQWLPYPHFNLQVEYQALDRKGGDDTTHFGFIMAQMYY